MQLKDCFEKALEASRELNCVSASKIDRTLTALADAAEKHTDEILEANREDLARMEPSDPMYDRLLLNRERIAGIAADIRNVASLPSPLGKILSETVRPNGMKITKVSVPFGVIGVIYEARPNVGFDVFSLCLKSGNACILKGGSDARCSNEAIVRVIREVLREQGLDENCVTLMPADRAATAELLNAVGYVDLIIPRGSKGLIDFVRQNAHVPVIETGAGICVVRAINIIQDDLFDMDTIPFVSGLILPAVSEQLVVFGLHDIDKQIVAVFLPRLERKRELARNNVAAVEGMGERADARYATDEFVVGVRFKLLQHFD